MKAETIERRTRPRRELSLRIRSRRDDSIYYAQDISTEGMFVTSEKPSWPGTILRLRMVLPGQERAICLSARVEELHSVPRGVGLRLRFLRVDPQATLAILRYIDRIEHRRKTAAALRASERPRRPLPEIPAAREKIFSA